MSNTRGCEHPLRVYGDASHPHIPCPDNHKVRDLNKGVMLMRPDASFSWPLLLPSLLSFGKKGRINVNHRGGSKDASKIGDVRKKHTLTYLYNITYGFAKDSWGTSDITVNGVSSYYGSGAKAPYLFMGLQPQNPIIPNQQKPQW